MIALLWSSLVVLALIGASTLIAGTSLGDLLERVAELLLAPNAEGAASATDGRRGQDRRRQT